MKKLILVALLLMSINLIYAELVVDIPFDLDIVGDSFAANGSYSFESDWITVSNTGSSAQSYTFMYSNTDLPTGWVMSFCNDTGTCYMPNSPVPFDIAAGESILIHVIIDVASTDSFEFPITFDNGDLTEPLIYNFTFRTDDYVVSAENELTTPKKLSQNYPNPFNPSTTISYTLSSEELTGASIEIYNTKGQLVKSFSNLNPTGNVVWEGKDNNNNIVNSGVYFYKLNYSKTSKSKKMVLVK